MQVAYDINLLSSRITISHMAGPATQNAWFYFVDDNGQIAFCFLLFRTRQFEILSADMHVDKVESIKTTRRNIEFSFLR